MDLERYTKEGQESKLQTKNKRTVFNMTHNLTTTFIAGKLIPILVKPVLPGDTIKINLKSLIRMVTPQVPVMDNLICDIYAFYIPNRLCTMHQGDWEKIQGVNYNSAWAPKEEATLLSTQNMISNLSTTSNILVQEQSLLNYLGFPINYSITNNELMVNTLSIRGYYSIWNDWFRDEKTENIRTLGGWASTNNTSSLFNDPILTIIATSNKGLQYVNKKLDKYTSAYLEPQRGEAVTIPLGGEAATITATGAQNAMLILENRDASYNTQVGATTTGQLDLSKRPTQSNISPLYIDTENIANNLKVDLSEVTAATINQLRQAFAIQAIYEIDAKGSKYNQLLKNHWGTAPTDLTLNRSQYLGSTSFDLNITQVLNQTINEQGPLGTTGAYSNTYNQKEYLVNQSFSDYGYVYIMLTIRPYNTYSLGLPRDLTNNRRFDYPTPLLANLGMQPIYKYELYALGNKINTDVFGYQEAWIDYKESQNRANGYVAINSSDSTLHAWTYQEMWNEAPTLNESFIQSHGQEVVDSTLAAQGGKYQFIAQFKFEDYTTRELPYYSTPATLGGHF